LYFNFFPFHPIIEIKKTGIVDFGCPVLDLDIFKHILHFPSYFSPSAGRRTFSISHLPSDQGGICRYFQTFLIPPIFHFTAPISHHTGVVSVGIFKNYFGAMLFELCALHCLQYTQNYPQMQKLIVL